MSYYGQAVAQHYRNQYGKAIPRVGGYYGQAVAQHQRNAGDDPRIVENPDYYNTAAGQAELAQRQQINAETQMRELQHELTRQGQMVQVGGQVLSPEQRSQMQQVSQDSLAALNSLSPFVQSGMMDADSIRKVVGQVATDTFNDQRTQRQIARDLDVLNEGYRTGKFSVEQVSSAQQQLMSKYGEAAVLRNPTGAEMFGVSSQLKQAQDEMVQAESAKYGVPFRWDDRANRPVRDDEAVTSTLAKLQIDRLNQEVAELPRKQKLEALKSQMSDISRLIVSGNQSGKGVDPGLYKRFDKLAIEHFNAANPQQTPAPAVAPAATDGFEDLARAITNTQSLSLASPDTPRFNSREEAAAAATSGELPVGKVTVVAGQRLKWTGTKFERAN